MKKIWKYVAGFFTLLGGILIAFLSGKGAGRKDEKLKGLKSESKKVSKRIKDTETGQKALEKSLKNKKKAIEELKKEGKYKSKDVGAADAAKFLKNYKKKK